MHWCFLLLIGIALVYILAAINMGMACKNMYG
jgi:hypothetical protein